MKATPQTEAQLLQYCEDIAGHSLAELAEYCRYSSP